MKTENIKKEFSFVRFPYALSIKSMLLCGLILMGFHTPVQAQQDSVKYTQPSWYFGVAAGGNINFYRGSTQQLNAELTVPTTFHDGSGVGLFVAPLIEYRPANSRWGVMLQAGYDNRSGKFNEVTTPCNCPADLNTDLSYLTVEPSLRFEPFKSGLYIYAGPRLAINTSKAFTYQLGLNPAIPDQILTAPVTGNFSDIRPNMLSMQVGAGFDIPLTSQNHKTQFMLSPFVSFQPYFGQDPRSIETWNVTTLRIGAALKLGSGYKIAKSAKATPVKKIEKTEKTVVAADPEVTFSVNSPKNIVGERRVRETFPIRNYVFFDLNSTEIPNRYILLKKSEVKDFREDQLEVFTPKVLSGRSDRQMVAYYNVLNILGDRMQKYPTTTVRLTGASMQGPEDGMEMAQSVKKYLVDVWGIDPVRIKTEGRVKPRIPSELYGGTKDLELVRECDRRVSIWSESPELTMEFHSGPDVPLRSVALNVVQEAPIDSYVVVNVKKGDAAFTSWTLDATDEYGNVQNFGPYTHEKISISGKSILVNRTEGDYKLKMTGKTKNGNSVVRETTVHVVLWKEPLREEGMRYSILYEFNKSKSIEMYQKYLTDIVVPKIPINGLVIIHGHSDIIGDSVYNRQLSLDRANDVKMIMENALKVSKRNDVRFEVFGFGKDKDTMPFDNKYPEGRFYNRTVIIDIIPSK
jgi:outer membrane protein OmpA-like peptidoglycan-associated protein